MTAEIMKKIILRNDEGMTEKGMFPMTKEVVQHFIDLYNCPDEFLNKTALKQKQIYFGDKEQTRVDLPEVYQPTVVQNLDEIIQRLYETGNDKMATKVITIKDEIEDTLPQGV